MTTFFHWISTEVGETAGVMIAIAVGILVGILVIMALSKKKE